MLFGLLCMALAVAALFPETPTGRALKALLIEAPVRKFAWVRRTHLFMAIGIALMAAVLILLFKTEGMFLVAGYVPEGVAWLAAFDIATYLDVFAVVWLAAATVRLRTVWRFAKAALTAVGPAARRALRIGARGRTQRRPRPRSRPGNDEDGGWGLTAYA